MEFVQGQFTEKSADISECFCCIPVGRGQTKIQVRFDKNVFFANERAHAEVVCDNSKCELAVKCIEFVVHQKIYIHS